MNILKKSAGQVTEVSLDAFELDKRVIWVYGKLNSQMANSVIRKLLYLDSDNRVAPISLIMTISETDRKSVSAIIDIIRSIKAPVYTYVVEEVCGFGVELFKAGKKRMMFESAKLILESEGTGFIKNERKQLNVKEAIEKGYCDEIAGGNVYEV